MKGEKKMNLFGVLVALGLYSQTFVVTEVNITEPTPETPTGYVLILEDYNGNLWECEADDGDWFVGDIATAIMDSNGTESIYDDEFVCVTYSGTIEGFLFPTDLTAIE